MFKIFLYGYQYYSLKIYLYMFMKVSLISNAESKNYNNFLDFIDFLHNRNILNL